MNEKAELTAESRTVLGKQVRRLRRRGLIPAILYGNSGPSVPLQVDPNAVHELLHRAGVSALLRLKVAGGETTTALIKQLQYHPSRGDLLHVDFLRVAPRERLRTKVPLRFVGEAPVAETHDVVIVRPVDAVTVECLPSNLPSAVEVDLSRLTDPHSAIHVADLAPGKGVQILDQPDEVVASVSVTARETIEELKEAAEAAEAAEEKAAEAAVREEIREAA